MVSPGEDGMMRCKSIVVLKILSLSEGRMDSQRNLLAEAAVLSTQCFCSCSSPPHSPQPGHDLALPTCQPAESYTSPDRTLARCSTSVEMILISRWTPSDTQSRKGSSHRPKGLPNDQSWYSKSCSRRSRACPKSALDGRPSTVLLISL